jgi:radical S-adenosyl methionine domain-containing protein 2
MNKMIKTVNYHIWKACNMRCKFCYATFQDITTAQLPKGHLTKESSMKLIELLSKEGFEKINFAGGEPTLCPWLPELVIYASSLGLRTSIVTNGWTILKSDRYLRRFEGKLDIVGLSIDSVDDSVNILSERANAGKTCISKSQYQFIAKIIKKEGIYLKINTVVSATNVDEKLSDFINSISPDRWKILQMLPVKGQNDLYAQAFSVTSEQFDHYISRNHNSLNSQIRFVPENHDAITGSYIMINPEGCFFDDTKGEHTNSSKILDIGVNAALAQVTSSYDKFLRRGGEYN